nr:class IIb bacteriocin, lactobin A/cerein 7B family [uncultured Carboxylicivirga sp.]
MKNLNDLGVQEMDAKELQKTDGGIIFGMIAYNYAAIGVVGLAIYGGFMSGYNAGKEDANK